eukprot:3546836-Amphidinium_carterae.2
MRCWHITLTEHGGDEVFSPVSGGGFPTSMEEKFTMGLTVAAAQLDHQWSDRWVDQCVIDSCIACTLSEEHDITGTDCADPYNSLSMEEPEVLVHSMDDHYDHRVDKDSHVRSEVTMVKVGESSAVDEISKD